MGASVAQAADIIGTITLKGAPPPEIPYTPLVNDPSFQAHYENEPTPTTQFFVVGPNHGLGGVIVYLQNVNQSTGPSQPAAVLDQKWGLYHPQIMAIQTGQTLLVKNSDTCMYDVDVRPTMPGNPASNQSQQAGSPPLSFTFPEPEMFITFKCDIDPWMFAWVSVMSSPYYDISSKEGKFVIENVPSGTYTVAAAHRKLGRSTKQVVVQGDKDVIVNFTFDISRAGQIIQGRKIFGTICFVCHKPNGEGVPHVYPPLAGSSFLNANKDRAIRTVIFGRHGEIVVNGKKFNNIMPSPGLTDQQIANVLTFVYSSFGNSGLSVASAEVKALRAQGPASSASKAPSPQNPSE